jgi:hypothetical protein
MLNVKICFIHVAKCGGTSIVEAIKNKYRLRDRLLRKNKFVTVNASASTKGSDIVNESLWGYREKILAYYLSIGSNKFVAGHFPFSDLAFKSYQDEWKFISLLRNPVDRWFSHYFFNRYKKQEHFKTNLSIDEYLETEDSKFIGQLYHHIFYGRYDHDMGNSDEAYLKAIGNIDKLTCVGVVEHMDKFCQEFNRQFGARLKIKQKNKNPLSSTDQLTRITDDVRRKVEKICEPDLKIYHYVLQKVLSQKEFS